MAGGFHGASHYVQSSYFSDWVQTQTGSREKAFGEQAVDVPTTMAAVRVPETALMPRLLIRSRDRLSRGDADLADHGVPGYRTDSEDAELVARICAGSAGARAGAPSVSLSRGCVDGGIVKVERSSFVQGEADLDELCEAASASAAGMRDVAPALQPRPFDDVLDPPAWADPGYMPANPFDLFARAWWDAFRQAAAEFNMVLEDPAAYHLAYGWSPVPGRAMGVLRGRLGGDLSGPVRLAFHDTRVPESTRGAVLFPAAPGSPPTPPGGGFYAKTEQWCAVVDGIA